MSISPSFWRSFIGRMSGVRGGNASVLSNEAKQNLLMLLRRISQDKPHSRQVSIVELAKLIDGLGQAAIEFCARNETIRLAEYPGCETLERHLVKQLNDRRLAVAATMEFSAGDAGFLQAVKAGDKERDLCNWERGEVAYRHALSFYPLHCGYRTQLAHMLKEQRRWEEAILSYRDALALGAIASDVLPHLEFATREAGRGLDIDTVSQIVEFWSDATREASRWEYPPTYADFVNLKELVGFFEPMLLVEVLQVLTGATTIAVIAERLAVRLADTGGEMSALLTSAMMIQVATVSAASKCSNSSKV